VSDFPPSDFSPDDSAGSGVGLTVPSTLRGYWAFIPVRRFLLCNFALFLGVSMQATTLFWQVYDITGREIDIGIVGLAEFLPAIALVLITGSVADRVDRRRVAIGAIGLEFLVAGSLMFYALSNPSSVVPLFGLALVFGGARAFHAPAIRAMPPMVAPEGGLPRTMALSNATWTAAVIFGPISAGILISIDPWMAYAGAVVALGAGWVGLFRLQFLRRPTPPDPKDRPSIRSALEGLHFIRRTPVLFAAISLDLLVVLVGGAVALLPVIAKEQLGVGDVAYGWLRAAPGIGAAAMALWLAAHPVRRKIGPTLLATVAVFGVGTLALGLTGSFVVAFIALLVLHAADMVSVYIRSTLVPQLTPDEKRGRVLAVENVFIGGSNELGAFRAGAVAQGIGVQATVVAGGIATLAIVGVWSLVFPSMRRADRFEDLSAEQSAGVTAQEEQQPQEASGEHL